LILNHAAKKQKEQRECVFGKASQDHFEFQGPKSLLFRHNLSNPEKSVTVFSTLAPTKGFH
jgi:hypothetical protein